MNAERWSQIQSLFDAVLEQDPPKRITFLKAACKDDLELYKEVSSLLESDQQINSLIDGQALDSVTISNKLLEETQLEGQEVGPYKLIKKLGQGGMGVVYLAERADGQFEQKVALKLIKKGMDSEMIVRRFLAERQILATLDHPNIARLLDGGLTPDGLPYFAMEYVEGVPIIPYCNVKKASIEERLALFQDICKTVHYAHRNLVVHRDLKPGNILVNREGQIKLLDFGIARMLTDDGYETKTVFTQAGHRVLTPEYAAPEQVSSGPITTQTDIYALGVVLYELLTGLRPLKISSHSPAEVEVIIRNETPTRPSAMVSKNEQIESTHAATPEKLSKKLHGDLDTICLKALQKEPERRYSSADEFMLDIDRHIKGMPVAAQPDSITYRLNKFYTRQKTGIIAALLILLALASIITMYTLRLRQATEVAQQEAVKAEQTATFLASLFEGANPLVAQGDTLNARHMLDAGADRVAEELADQPEVQASLLTVIGDAYNGLGLYPQAEKHFQQALEFTQATQGHASHDAALLLQRMADIRHSLSDFPGADSLQRATLDIQKALYGEEHPEIAATLLKMASTNRSIGNYDVAIPLYEQAVALNEKLLPKDDPELAWSVNNLGWAYYNQGRFDEAIEAYERAEFLQRTYLGETHPDLGFTLNNYGGLLWTTGDFEQGEAKLRESLSIRRGLYGEEHPETMQSLNNLATMFFRKGEIDAAEPLYRQILETNTRLLGKNHRYVASTTSSLGVVMLEKGKLEEAEELLIEALNIRKSIFGESHRQVSFSQANLASVYLEKGEHAKSVAMYEQSISFWRETDTRHVDMAYALVGLGSALNEHGHPEKAETLIREALALRLEHLEEDDLLVARARGALGRCLMLQNKTAEAQEVLQQAQSSYELAGKTSDRRARKIAKWLESLPA